MSEKLDLFKPPSGCLGKKKKKWRGNACCTCIFCIQTDHREILGFLMLTSFSYASWRESFGKVRGDMEMQLLECQWNFPHVVEVKMRTTKKQMHYKSHCSTACFLTRLCFSFLVNMLTVYKLQFNVYLWCRFFWWDQLFRSAQLSGSGCLTHPVFQGWNQVSRTIQGEKTSSWNLQFGENFLLKSYFPM